jgi:hypothetical protein
MGAAKRLPQREQLRSGWCRGLGKRNPLGIEIRREPLSPRIARESASAENNPAPAKPDAGLLN